MKNRNFRKYILRYAFLLIVFLICSASSAQYPGWTVYNTSNSGLPDNGVLSIEIDAVGNKWIGTSGGGMAKFDGANWIIYDTSNSGLPGKDVYQIAIDDSGNKWVGTNNGLARFDGANWTVYMPAYGEPLSIIYRVTIEKNGNKWVAAMNSSHTFALGGLAQFDGSNWRVYTPSTSGLPYYDVTSIAIDDSGNKWIGTAMAGVAKFGGTNWTVYNPANSGLPNINVMSIVIDSSGNKWIGTYGGLAKFDGTNWTVYNSANSGLPIDTIFSLAIDAAGNKWIGTLGSGLKKFDGNNWILFNASNSGLPSNYVYSIKIDKSGDIWIGTNQGLAVLSGKVGITTIRGLKPLIPLCRNYPNPFKQRTLISYDVLENGPIGLRIYSLEGQLVQTLVNSRQTAGSYTVSWNGANDKGKIMARGVYLYQLNVNGISMTRQMNFVE
jgi:ligand-binding sensor domain-containing protein